MKRLLIPVLAAGALVVTPCRAAEPVLAPVDPGFHYVDDTEASGKYVAFVATRREAAFYYCAGSIIDRRFILTAAHCVSPKAGATMVYFGTDMRRFQRGGRGMPTADVKINPRYFDDAGSEGKATPWWQDQHDADLAVIKLPRDVPDGYEPVELDYTTTHKTDGHFSRTIAGYSLGYGDILTSDGKKKLDIRLKRKDLGGLLVFEYSNILLAVPRKAAYSVCSGDSGGPIMLSDGAATPRQIGVNSRADLKCQGTAAPAPIADNYDWIRDAMISLKAPSPVPARPDYAGGCVQRATGQKSVDGKPSLEITITNSCTTTVRCIDAGWYRTNDGSRTLFKNPVDLKPGEIYAKTLAGVKATADEVGMAACSRVEDRSTASSRAGP